MYHPSQRIKAVGGTSLGQVYDPYFNRSYRHFCSHQHTPYKPEASGYDMGVINGSILYLAHPVFALYCDYGAVPYQEILVKTIRRFMGDDNRIAVEGLPSTGRVSLMRQAVEGRYILHLLHANTVKRGGGSKRPQGVEVIQEILPVRGIAVELEAPEKISRVTLEPEGKEIPFAWFVDPLRKHADDLPDPADPGKERPAAVALDRGTLKGGGRRGAVAAAEFGFVLADALVPQRIDIPEGRIKIKGQGAAGIGDAADGGRGGGADPVEHVLDGVARREGLGVLAFLLRIVAKAAIPHRGAKGLDRGQVEGGGVHAGDRLAQAYQAEVVGSGEIVVPARMEDQFGDFEALGRGVGVGADKNLDVGGRRGGFLVADRQNKRPMW